MPNDIVPNIGERGAAQRRKTGTIWGIASLVVAAMAIITHHDRWALLLLPLVSMAVMGRLQARERT